MQTKQTKERKGNLFGFFKGLTNKEKIEIFLLFSQIKKDQEEKQAKTSKRAKNKGKTWIIQMKRERNTYSHKLRILA